MAVILSGANGSLYFSCGVYGTSGKIQGFFPFGFAQGQNDDRRIYLNEIINPRKAKPPNVSVLSAEAPHSFTVRGAVEKSASLPEARGSVGRTADSSTPRSSAPVGMTLSKEGRIFHEQFDDTP